MRGLGLTTLIQKTMGKEYCEVNMDTSNLDKVRELTAELQDYDMFSHFVSPTVLELKTEDGHAVTHGLYKVKDVAVARSYIKGGTRWPPHFHRAWEYIILYRGEMHIGTRIADCQGRMQDRNGDFVVLAPGFFYMRPKVLHSVYFPIDSYAIAVTVPAAEGFPDGIARIHAEG